MPERTSASHNTHRIPEPDTSFDPDSFDAVDPESPDEAPSPFDDLDRIRVDHNYLASVGAATTLRQIRVQRPHREWFIRTHLDPRYTIDTGLLILQNDREGYYYVDRALWSELRHSGVGFDLYRLRLAVTRDNLPFLWHIRLPGEDGRRGSWAESDEDAAILAASQWIRVYADRQKSGYQVVISSLVSTPTWPTISFQELLKMAFRDRIIDSFDHLVLRRLSGRA